MNNGLLPPILTLAGNIFVVAIKIAAPIIVSLLLTTVALGLLARTVPQMNIFIVAMPLKILVGLIFLGLSLPFLVQFLSGLFSGFGHEIIELIRLVGS
jgi:flagellar biosynthetic protein FliR